MEDKFVDGVIQDALKYLGGQSENAPEIITFSLYFDHEGRALSVCADTLESSQKCVAQMNAFSFKYFAEAVEQGDLSKAALWQGNIGRSLSLGDFKHVNLARKNVPRRIGTPKLFPEMVKAMIRHTPSILGVCDQRQHIVFSTSTATEEVGLVWSPPEQV